MACDAYTVTSHFVVSHFRGRVMVRIRISGWGLGLRVMGHGSLLVMGNGEMGKGEVDRGPLPYRPILM